MLSLRKILPLPLCILLLSGCATTAEPEHNPDPFEGLNRAIFEFNDSIDELVLKPVAEGYEAAMPEPLNNSVSNFFNNLDDVLVILNDILQLKFGQTLSDIGRFTLNSSFGLFGLFDVATPLNLPKHNEDFGQTLGRWGVGSGPYLVLPLLGDSTLRDSVGLVTDWQVDPVGQIEGRPARWGAITLESIDTRASLLRASRILDTAALDRYTFRRDAYLQRRNSLVYDGNVPQSELDEFDPFADEQFDPLSEDPPLPAE